MPGSMTITLQVEEEAVGRTLKQLKKMRGVSDIDLDLEKRSKRMNGAAHGEASGKPRFSRGVGGKPGREVFLDLLAATNKPVRQAEVKTVFEAQGRSPLSVHSLAHELRADGLIKATDDGYIKTKKFRDRLRWQNKGSKKKK